MRGLLLASAATVSMFGVSTAWATDAPAQPAPAQDAVAPAQDGAAPAAAPSALSEVVVTARKTVETVQKAPASIVAVAGAELQSQDVTNPQLLEMFLPSASLRTEGPVTQSFIRGVGSNIDIPYVDPAVAFVENGIVIPRYGTSGLVSISPACRSSQAHTLYGGSAAGGAIKPAHATARLDLLRRRPVGYWRLRERIQAAFKGIARCAKPRALMATAASSSTELVERDRSRRLRRCVGTVRCFRVSTTLQASETAHAAARAKEREHYEGFSRSGDGWRPESCSLARSRWTARPSTLTRIDGGPEFLRARIGLDARTARLCAAIAAGATGKSVKQVWLVFSNRTGELKRERNEVLVRLEVVREADPKRGGRIDEVAGHRHLTRPSRADPLLQTHEKQASADAFAQMRRCEHSALGGHDEIAAECDLQAAGCGRTIHGRDLRNSRVVESCLVEWRRPPPARQGALVEFESAAEPGVGARDDDTAGALRAIDRGAKRLRERLVDLVARFGPVERDEFDGAKTFDNDRRLSHAKGSHRTRRRAD
jgi:hypothetical protein